MVPVLVGITLIVFFLSHIVPGDPIATALGPTATKEAVQRLKKAWGLDKPLPQQYLIYIKNLIRGDFGFSIYTRRPVAKAIQRYFMATLELSTLSLLIAFFGGVITGTICAAKKNGIIDFILRPATLFGMSMPVFWLGLLLLLIFYYQLGIIPIGGRMNPAIDLRNITGMYIVDSLLTGNWIALKSAIYHIITPAFCLAFMSLAVISRQTRTNVLETLNNDYIRSAKAKGVSETSVLFKHALKNAFLPIITITAIQYGYLLGRSVIVEVIFSWPGIGRYALQAIKHLDLQPVLAFTIIITLVYMIGNLIADISYAFLDPKVKYS